MSTSKPTRRGRGALYQAVPTEPAPLVNRSQLEGRVRVGRAPLLLLLLLPLLPLLLLPLLLPVLLLPPSPPLPLPVAVALGAVVGAPACTEGARLWRIVAPQCNSSPHARMKRTTSTTGGAGGAGHEGGDVSTSVTFPGPSTSSSSISPPISSISPPISPPELPISSSSSSQ